MPTLLFINACVRGEDSRTLALAQQLLECIREANSLDMTFQIEEIRLSTEHMLPLNYERLKRREELLAAGQINDTMFDYANAVANADMLVIAAPYWDMSFPAVLKIFYVTTSGAYIGDCNFGFDYADALCRLYGVENTHFVCAEGLDIEDADAAAILEKACSGEILNF